MSTFSANGSPTWTLGSFLRAEDLLAGSDPSDPVLPDSSPANVSDASTDTPPMPSKPVRDPYRITLFPTPVALAVYMSFARSTPMHPAFTSGLPAKDESNTISPPILASPRQFPYPEIPATTPGTTRWESAAAAGPKRNWSVTATGRAPMARMSRTMPPTPVAAPW